MATKQLSGSISRGLTRLERERGKGWEYDKKTRGVVNVNTGERLSRRQFDKTYGLLKEQGFRGFEEKRDYRKEQKIPKTMKSKHNFSRFPQKTFESREEMLNFVEAMGETDYAFRVILGGQAAADVYQRSGDGKVYHYNSGQLAFKTGPDFVEWYRENQEQTEKGFSSIETWTLTAYQTQKKPVVKNKTKRKPKAKN